MSHTTQIAAPKSGVARGAPCADVEDLWLPEALRASGIGPDQLSSVEALWKREKVRNASILFSTTAVKVGILSSQRLAELRGDRFGLPCLSRRDLHRRASDLGSLQRRLGPSMARLKARLLSRSGDVVSVLLVEPQRAIMEEVARLLAQQGVLGRMGVPAQERHDFFVISELDFHEFARVERDGSVPLVQETSSRRSVEEWLKQAIVEDASDLHIVPKETSLEIRYRIDGRLWTKEILPLELRDEVIANVKMFGGLDVGRKLEPLDGSVKFEIGSRGYKLRFSSIPTQFGQHVVIRILDQNSAVLPFSDLGISEADLSSIHEAMTLPQGLVFLVGPTGSGKSTTLASLISQLDGQAYSIRTLENPIEYRLGNAVQAEVGPEMPFARGLRALLRQDPDYILVGETRDLETAEIAIEAGLTGHMCFSTLHGNDAIGGIVRLLDIGVEVGPMLSACHLFIAQRLVRRLCDRCKRPSENGDLLVRRHELNPGKGERLWEPVGCPECREGFRGRIGIYEARWLRDFEEAVLAAGVGCAPKCRAIAKQRGLPSMRDDGMSKALRGLTTVDEVLAQIVT